MKNLITTLALAGSLAFSGCNEENNQLKEEVGISKKILPFLINNSNESNFNVYEDLYRTFIFAGATIEACTFSFGGDDGKAIKITKKDTDYVFRFYNNAFGDTTLVLDVFAKNFNPHFVFRKNSETNSSLKEKAETKGYQILNIYNNILYKEKLTEDSIKKEKQKRIDEAVLRNL